MRNLTNEQIKKMFRNNFDLVNFAIEIGKNVVKAEEFTSLDDLIHQIKRQASSIEDPELKAKYGMR